MKRYVLCGKYFQDRESAFRYMKEIFGFPGYAGHNLDALWDLLRDEPDRDIEITQARFIVRQMGDYGISLLDLFGDLQAIEGFNIHIYW
ncbi:barstar family protein [Kallipyga gabonensis]|uniref:barstar family protein n=1 Tax=Kallipyga gabonensis TaxID=1686287 RepID=UPI0006B686FA|nr:barstar family protein [Kallipyga gabonensis]